MKELSTEMTMTVKEVAEVLKVNSRTVLRSVEKLYPDIIENGKTTYLSEYQVTRIKEQIFKNVYLDNPVEVTTELEMSEMTLKVLTYQVEKISNLQSENEALKPKAIEFDKFMSGGNCQSIGDVAKVLKVGRNTLFKLLRESGILMDNNVPYQQYMKYFEVIEKPIDKGSNVENQPVTLVKPEGVDYISKKILN